MKNLPSPFGLKSPFGSEATRWLYGYSENLSSEPYLVTFNSRRALDGVWKFRASGSYPPFVGADIASGTFPIVAGLNADVGIDLTAYPDETGYLFFAGTDANGRYSNWLRSSQFTTPAAATPEIAILGTQASGSTAGGTDYTFSNQVVSDGKLVLCLMHYNGGSARTTNYVRLNGVNMTLLGAAVTLSTGHSVSWWYLNGVTAGTYDITVNLNLGVTNIRQRNWSTNNDADFANAVLRSQVSTSTNSRSVSGDIAAGGAIFAGVASSTTFTDIDYTGVTEDQTYSAGTNLGRNFGSAVFPSAVVGQSVVATGTGGPAAMVHTTIYVPPVP